MNRSFKILFFLLLAVTIVAKLLGIGMVSTIAAKLDKIAPPPAAEAAQPAQAAPDAPVAVAENGRYDDAAHVAAYLVRFGRLPGNFLTKNEARARGWDGGPLEPFAPGCSIGGDHFGNFEGKLPRAKGRKYRECDLEATGKRRGPVRLIWSNDGLFFVTRDHYESFEALHLPGSCQLKNHAFRLSFLPISLSARFDDATHRLHLSFANSGKKPVRHPWFSA